MDFLVTYAAGLFDGEGMVRINRYRRTGHLDRFALSVMIGMCNPDAILTLRDRFGGSLHTNHHEERNQNHRPQYCWFLGSDAAARFLEAIQPYSIIKRLEIEVALEFQRNVRQWAHKLSGHSPHRSPRFWTHPDAGKIIAERQEMADRLSKLKHLSYALP